VGQLGANGHDGDAGTRLNAVSTALRGVFVFPSELGMYPKAPVLFPPLPLPHSTPHSNNGAPIRAHEE
jgi:hypothetical protein